MISFDTFDIVQDLAIVGVDRIFRRQITLFCYDSVLDCLGIRINKGGIVTLLATVGGDVYLEEKIVDLFVEDRIFECNTLLSVTGEVKKLEKHLLWDFSACGEPAESEYEEIECCYPKTKDAEGRYIHGYVIVLTGVSIELYSKATKVSLLSQLI